MSPARGVLFDLDGVLVDSREAWLETLNEILEAHDLTRVTPERFAESFGQSSEADARSFFGGRLTTAELDARYGSVFPRHVSSVRPIEGDTAGLLEELRARGVRTAITTNAPAGTAAAMLAGAGLAGLVETVVTPDDVAHPKPAPDMLLEACRRLSLAPVDVVLVGDSPIDAGAGRAAGIRVIGYRTGGGDHRIERLRDVVAFLL